MKKTAKVWQLFCDSPIGKIKAPQGIAKIILNETNEELLKNLYSEGGFIDPFRFAECMKRRLK